MAKIHEKLSEYGYEMFTRDEQIELLLNYANVPDIKSRMKKLKDSNVSLYDLFAESEKARQVMSDPELKGIKALRMLVSSYLEEGMRKQPAQLTQPETVAEYLRTVHQDNLFEKFTVLYMDTKNNLLKCETMAEGTIDQAIVYPRNICKRALELNAASVIISHNHPSGICEPSRDDIKLTTALKNALEVLEIKVLDHLIIGHKHGYFSFREKGLMDGYSSRGGNAAAEKREEYRSKNEETESKSQSLLKKVDSKLEELSKKLDSPETEMEVREFLKFMAKFHRYSLGNQLLIMFESMLRGTSIETVASYKFWSETKNEKGEHASVKRGEKGYSVLVPVMYKLYEQNPDGSFKLDETGEKIPRIDPETGKEIKRLAFKSGAVFDVNQTTAKDIGAYKSLEYRSSGEMINEITLDDTISGIKEKYGLSVKLEPVSGSAKGYYSYQDNEIVVDNKSDKTNDMKLSTLFHELGHHLLHGEEIREKKEKYEDIHIDRGAREGEAEAFSYALSSMFGIENKSELYIRNWGNTGTDLKERLNRIRTAVRETIETLGLDKNMAVLQDNELKETEKVIILKPISESREETPEEGISINY